jgi:hypothetical protein
MPSSFIDFNKIATRQKFILALIFCLYAFTSHGQTGEVRGFVYDKITGEPVIYSSVRIEGTDRGAITDLNGFYSIGKISPGNYTLICAFIGYDTGKVNMVIKANDKISRNIYLQTRGIEMKEIDISAQKTKNETRVEASKISVTPREIQMLPSIGGQADLAQYLQILPGVVFTGDQGGQLYIRGGSPVQNKVLLDGMTIYNPFHSIGLFSVFDVDIIKNIDVYTAAFPGEYGGRVSSVMDISTREGNKDRIRGVASVSPFTSKLSLEGPITRFKEDGASSSYIFSARSSYLKYTAPILYSYADANGLPYTFLDLYGKVNFTAPGGSNINFFGFNFRDDVKFNNSTQYGWNSYGIGSKFLLVPSSSSSVIEGTFALSNYSASQQNPGEAVSHSSIGGFETNVNFINYSGKNVFKYGLNILGFNTDFNFTNSANRVVSQTDFTTEIAGFVRYNIVLGRLVLDPSIRLHYYASQGEFAPEPRIGMKYVLTDRLRLKLAGGFYSQNLMSVQSDRDVVNLFYGFISGPADLPGSFNGSARTSVLQSAVHGVGGFELDMGKHFNLDVETYIKNFTQLTNLNPDKIFDNTPDFLSKPVRLREDFILETGKAYGVDFRISYDKKPFYFWMTYSLSFVTRFDSVQTYYTNWDRRHSINLLGSFDLDKKRSWQINARFTFGSGFPFTKTAGFYDLLNFQQGLNTNYTTANGNLGVLYDQKINTGRLSYYHRMDVSLQKIYTFKKGRELRLIATVTNVYNRPNVFYFNRITYQRINQLPILPSIGITYSF